MVNNGWLCWPSWMVGVNIGQNSEKGPPKHHFSIMPFGLAVSDKIFFKIIIPFGPMVSNGRLWQPFFMTGVVIGYNSEKRITFALL